MGQGSDYVHHIVQSSYDDLNLSGHGTAAVVYVAAPPASIMMHPWAAIINGRCVLAHVFQRCVKFLNSVVQNRILLCDEASNAMWRSVLPLHLATVHSYTTNEIMSGLDMFFGEFQVVENIVLLPSTAMFFDCDVTIELLEIHKQRQADVTFARRSPQGYLPLIIRRSGMPVLRSIVGNPTAVDELFERLPKSFAYEQFKGTQAATVAAVTLFAERLEKLPVSVTIADAHAIAAAKAVVASLDDDLPSNHRPAQRFKEELIKRIPIPSLMLTKTSRPTILYSSLQAAFSGGEESLFQLITNLKSYRPMACFHCPTILSERLTKNGVPVEIADRNCSFPTKETITYYEQLINIANPSVVHVDGFMNQALMLVSRLRGIPVVAHVRMMMTPHIEKSVEAADIIIGVSNAVSSTLRQRNVAPDRVRTIYNGVDIERFSSYPFSNEQAKAILGIKETVFTICHAGRITPSKRIEMLLEAMSIVVRKGYAIHALIVGDTYDYAYINSLKRRADNLKLTEYIQWLSFTSCIERIYAASNALVLCSRWEPFGRCIIEAMAMGLPCIVPNSGGPSEVVVQGISGFVFDETNADNLAMVIVHLMTCEREISEMKVASKNRANEFSIQRHVNEVECLYGELIKR